MSGEKLRGTLGVARGTALMVNIVLGAGLLTLPGLALREVGQDAILVWLAAAILAVPLLVVFAIAGRNFPNAGGIAAVAGEAFGRRVYAATTLLFFGAVILGLPAIALTGGYYAATFVALPPHVLSAAILLLATGVNFLPAELAGRVNGWIASLLVLVLLTLAGLGAWAVLPAAPPAFHMPGHSLSVYASVFMMIFFAFTGWEVAANLSEEFRNPRRDVPLAMAFSFLVAVSFYLVLAGIIGASGIASGFEAPFATLFSAHYGNGASHAVSAVAVLLIFANLSSAIWAVSRMVYSAAREGLLPEGLSRTRDGVPLRSVACVVLALLTVLALSGQVLPLPRLLEFAGQNFLLIYGIAALAILRACQHIGARIAGALAAIVVLAVLAAREPSGLAYPVVLALVGAVLPRRQIERKA